MSAILDKLHYTSVGDIIQLNPDVIGNKAFAACLAIVSEKKDWGVQCYVQALGATRDEDGGQAFIRVKWSEFERTGGTAVWVVGSVAEEVG